MNGSFKERRSQSRFLAKIPLSFYEPNTPQIVNAQTHDISAQGISIVTSKEIPVGTSLDIYIQMPDTGEKIFRRGKVVWLSSFNHSGYKLGIKLEEPPLKPIPLVLRAIKAYRDY
ncbi:MAG: PilZ domain-containing protein [Candidatus Omnitrophota bacterium]